MGQGVQIRAHSTASWSSKDEDIPLGAWCISAHLSPVLAPSLVSPCLYSVKRPLLSASICISLQLSHSVSLYIILWFVSLFFFLVILLPYCNSCVVLCFPFVTLHNLILDHPLDLTTSVFHLIVLFFLFYLCSLKY